MTASHRIHPWPGGQGWRGKDGKKGRPTCPREEEAKRRMRRIVTPNTRPLERTAQHRDNGGRAKSATASGKWSIFFFCIKIWIKCFFAFSIGVSASKGHGFLILAAGHRCATQLNNYNAALPQGKKGVAVPQPQTYEAQSTKSHMAVDVLRYSYNSKMKLHAAHTPLFLQCLHVRVPKK